LDLPENMVNVIISSRYTISRKKIRQITSEYLLEKGIGSEYVLNVVFVGRNKMKAITAQYKEEHQALPVLSFPYKGTRTEDGKMLGEILICYPLAILLAAERNKKVDDIMTYLIKHGIDNLLK